MDIKIYFEWSSYQPDQRPYRQNSVHLFPTSHVEGVGGPSPKIELSVPLDDKYIANYEDIMVMSLSNQAQPTPVLTLAGMRYVLDQFDAVLLDADMVMIDPVQEAEPDADDWVPWVENVPALSKPSLETTGDDEWAEAPDADAKWDEANEDWGQ